MPLDTFFELARPLVDGLSAAHELGIAHRDLKPDNVMVSDAGRLKILDFGVAKLREETPHDGLTLDPTRSLTDEGKIVGTVAYMSPEQAQGEPTDHRSDVFSLGVVLYEMAAGQRPFRGDTSMSVLSSIIKDTPVPVTDLNDRLPRQLERILRHRQRDRTL